MRPALAALILLTAFAPARASDPMPDRPWPVEMKPAVASSFCEYREGHLHAGLDVRTYGRVGVPCIAVGDGYVSRVHAAPTGYGKALYIQLDSGETAVYAHLSQFTPAVDSMMWAQQRRLGRYRVDFRPTPNAVRVRRGDVVAWSGNTGGVDPHLHFEVRNRREHPLDPFTRGFALDDSLRPVIEKIAFVPLDVNARVDGGSFPVEYHAVPAGPGRYAVDDTVAVVAGVGLRLLAHDLQSAISGRLAPKSIEVSVDGDPVADIEFDTISFASSDEVGFVYDVGRRWTDKESWYLLYERAGETLRGRTFHDGGRLPTAAMARDVGTLRVVVTDAVGNGSELDVPIRRSPEGTVGAGHRVGCEIDGLYGFEGMMSVDLPEGEPLQPALGGQRVGPARVFDAADMKPEDSSALPWTHPLVLRSNPPRRVEIAPAIAGQYRSVDFPDLRLELQIAPGTLYSDEVFYATPGPGLEAGENPELTARGGAVQVGPYSMSLKADMTLAFDVPAPDSTDAVYRRTERSGKWVFYPSQRDGNTVTTRAKRPGVYGVFRDVTPPTVYQPRVVGRLIYATGRRIPEIQVGLEDTGSGVDDSRCAVYLDGVAQIARWDGRIKKLFVLLRDENIMGTRALTVVAYDNVGHRTQLDTRIDIPRRK